MNTIHITVSPRTILCVLVVIAVGLTGLSILEHFIEHVWPTAPSYVSKILRRFNLDTEASIPTWFASAQLALSAYLVNLIACRYRQLQLPDVTYWQGLTWIFLACSIEEIAAFHEGVRWPMATTFAGLLHFTWVIPGTGVVLLVTGTYARFICRLPRVTRFYLLLAGTLYFGGALGMEMLEGHYIERYSEDHLAWLLSDVEELLEMIGASLFIYGWLTYLQVTAASVQLTTTTT